LLEWGYTGKKGPATRDKEAPKLKAKPEGMGHTLHTGTLRDNIPESTCGYVSCWQQRKGEKTIKSQEGQMWVKKN